MSKLEKTDLEKVETCKSVSQVDSYQSASSPDSSVRNLLNASGHTQQVNRNFNLLSLTGLGIVNGNQWCGLATTILVAIFNGGPPGVIYEFITVSVFYWTIAASIAELASAIPSSAGVYHWASITAGKKYGRIIGYYAGYWNCLGWTIGCASVAVVAANIGVQLYAITHPEYVSKSWHVFVAYTILTWTGCLSVCFSNQFMPYVTLAGTFLIVAGAFITIVVCAALPGRRGHHASSSFVWKEWRADVGYPDGFVFLAGMLNGAYAVGTPDSLSHLSEEIPRPHINVPKAIALQMAIGFIICFAYLITILYSINDLDALSSSSFPIAEIYAQGSGSAAGTIGLLLLILLPWLCAMATVYITAGRSLWTLARDGAAPCSGFLSKVSVSRKVPINATVVCAVLATLLGCIYLGNTTAFSAIVGSFIIMTTASYTAAILPNILTWRKNIEYGPFHMKGWLGFAVNGIACTYMMVFFIIFCFPYSLPTNSRSMNYSSLIFGGSTLFITAWYWLGGRKGYKGPQTKGGKVYDGDLIKKVSEVISSV